MEVQISSDKLPEPDKGLDHQYVADVFVRQYYRILEKTPEIVYRFYKDESVINRPGPDGEMTSVTTMQDISDTIMSSDYKGCLAEILNADAQESLMEGVIVAVNGYFVGNDSLRRSFYQTFFLARQEKGFYVLNDMLRFLDAHETLTRSASSETDESSLSVHLTYNTEALTEPINASALEDDGRKVSDVKDSHSSDAPIQNEATATKTSYASMVAKQSKVTPLTHTSGCTVVRVAPTADQQPKASPALKIPVVPSDSTTKELNASNNATENITHNGDVVTARSVYIGNLPSNISENGLLDAVKVFGRVRQGGIQLRAYEDGFCFGFVEFESASSARSAVEVHNITIGEKDAYIMYKKSSARTDNSSRGFRGGHFKGQENGQVHGDRVGQNVHPAIEGKFQGSSMQNGEANTNRRKNRDARGRGRESYRWNYQRSDEKRSSGEAYPRSYNRRDERLMNGEIYQGEQPKRIR